MLVGLHNAHWFKRAVWESVHLHLHKSQCLQNQYLKSIISTGSVTDTKQKKIKRYLHGEQIPL